MKMTRLAVVVSHPTQHFVPLYVELAKQQNIKLKVFFIAENGVQLSRDIQFGVDVKWDVPMTQGYPHEFVEPGKLLDAFTFKSVDSPFLIAKLKEFKADWLWLHGYAQRANWRALLNKSPSTQVMYTSDSNAASTVPFFKQAIKSLVIRFFFRRVDAFFSIGPANHDYLLRYGAAREKIYNTFFPVDIERLSAQREALQPDDVKAIRSSLNIDPNAHVLLVVGKLIERKRCHDAVMALSKLSNVNTHLVLVGSGDCEADLLKLAREHRLQNRVHIAGFVNQQRLPLYFALADVLLFPSVREPYGAVVAESLPFGLPIVIAKGIGAVGVSAIEGKNADVFTPENVAELANVIDALLSDEVRMKNYANYALSIAPLHDKTSMLKKMVDVMHNNY